MQENDLEILKQAALEAGEIAKKYHAQEIKIWEKPDAQGPVTEADLAVNAFLCGRFQNAFPDWAILSEEDWGEDWGKDREEDEDDGKRHKSDRLIVIDPIDGTKAFIDGENYYAISIAMIEKAAPVAGVIYAPALGELYFASSGNGAFCNDHKISVSPAKELTNAKILASRARYNRVALEVEPPLATTFLPSIALRLALIAKGAFDLTLALRPSWDWDIAAGDIILREAGGTLLDQSGKRPLYNQENPKQNGIVGGSEILVRAFLDRLNKENTNG